MVRSVPNPSPSSGATPGDRALLLLLAAVQFTHIMDFMVMMPLGPQLMRVFEIDPERFSLLVASYTFSAGIAGIAGALLVDGFDRRKALLFCYAGFLLGTLACALAPSYHWLMLARVVSGAFGGVAGSLVMTVVGDLIPLERRASAMGIIMMAFSVASVLGVPLGLWLAAYFSWHAPFYIVAVVGVCIWVCCLLRMPSMRGHLTEGRRGVAEALGAIREIVSSRNSQMAMLFMSLMVIGHFIIIPFLSPSLVANAGLAEKDLSFVYLAGGLASLFTAPLIGKLADRNGRLRMFILMILGAITPILVITNQGPAPLWFVLTTAVFFFIFAGGRFVPGQAIVTSAIPPRLRGSFMSLNASVRDFCSGVASYMGGHIVVQQAGTGELLHYPVLGWIAITASLLSIVVAARVKLVS